MKEEHDALMRNKTWEPVPCAREMKVIARIKELVNGSVEKLRSGLVDKEYLQVTGLDFVETFNPVAKHGTM